MGIKSMLAKSALKYAEDIYKGRGKHDAQKVDLEPLHRKLDALIAAQQSSRISYATLAVSLLTLLLVIVVLIRM